MGIHQLASFFLNKKYEKTTKKGVSQDLCAALREVFIDNFIDKLEANENFKVDLSHL